MVFMRVLYPGRIGMWKEENRRIRRKALGARTRTNNKLNPHMTPGLGIEPGPHWWEASGALTTASTIPALLKSPRVQNQDTFHLFFVHHAIFSQAKLGYLKDSNAAAHSADTCSEMFMQ